MSIRASLQDITDEKVSIDVPIVKVWEWDILLELRQLWCPQVYNE